MRVTRNQMFVSVVICACVYFCIDDPSYHLTTTPGICDAFVTMSNDTTPLIRSTDKVTVVIMSFHASRANNLRLALTQYQGYVSVIDRIVFVWNNPTCPPPSTPEVSGGVEVLTMCVQTSSMNNRFRVSSYCRTRAVVQVDDDVLLDENAFHELLRAHKRQPKRLIGIDRRYATRDGQYHLSHTGKIRDNLPLVIGKTWIVDVGYYQRYLGETQMVDMVTKERNCDDIVFNYVVMYYGGQSSAFIDFDKGRRKLLPEPHALSWSFRWFSRRSACVKEISNYYGPHEVTRMFFNAHNPTTMDKVNNTAFYGALAFRDAFTSMEYLVMAVRMTAMALSVLFVVSVALLQVKRLTRKQENTEEQSQTIC